MSPDNETESTQLESICWVHRPHDLQNEIEEAIDLCRECCEKRVFQYRAEFPSYADEIVQDGGWGQASESDSLAECYDCGKPLSCSLLGVEWEDTESCVTTLEEWQAADAKLSEENSQ